MWGPWAESPFSLSIARSRMEQKAQGSTRQSLAGCHLTQISDTPVLGFPHLQGKHSQRPRERSDCKATAKRSKIPQLRTHPSRVRLSPQAFACSRVTRVVQLGATTLSLETSPLSQPGGPSDAPPTPVVFTLAGGSGLRPRLTLGRVVVANVPDGASDHPLIVHRGRGRDLSAEQHHARLAHCLCEGGGMSAAVSLSGGAPLLGLPPRVFPSPGSRNKRIMLTNRLKPSSRAEYA